MVEAARSVLRVYSQRKRVRVQRYSPRREAEGETLRRLRARHDPARPSPAGSARHRRMQSSAGQWCRRRGAAQQPGARGRAAPRRSEALDCASCLVRALLHRVRGSPACARAIVILRTELAHALTAASQAQPTERRKRGRDTEEEEEEDEEEGEEGAAPEGARGADEPGSPGPAAGPAADAGLPGAAERGRGRTAHRYTLRDRSQHQVDFFKPGADDERARCGCVCRNPNPNRRERTWHPK